MSLLNYIKDQILEDRDAAPKPAKPRKAKWAPGDRIGAIGAALSGDHANVERIYQANETRKAIREAADANAANHDLGDAIAKAYRQGYADGIAFERSLAK